MSRPLLLPLLCVAIFSTSVSQAVVTEFTWAGFSGNPGANHAPNWIGGNAPSFVGEAEALIFPDSGTDHVSFGAGSFYTNSDIHSLTVTGHYHFVGPQSNFDEFVSPDPVYLHLYGGLFYSTPFENHLAFQQNLGINIAADQTWSIGANGRVEFYNNAFITGTGKITKSGAGLLDLGSASDGWSGGLQFNEGSIILRPGEGFYSPSVGSGTVIIGPDTTYRPTFQVHGWSDYGDYDYVLLGNAFVLNGVFNSENDVTLALAGNVTLNSDTTFRTSGDVTVIEGDITDGDGHAKLTVDSTSGIILYGSSNWSGGTTVTKGILVFGGEDNTPGTPGGILIGANGYAGIGVDNNVGGFISQINSASTGTIGFDSELHAESPDHFNTAASIDLSGFNPSVRLGSATSAILGENITITPYNNNYRFGGGGGWLQVNSVLTSGRTLELNSPAELPLTVRFTNPSNAISAVNVTNSGAVFATGALPGAATLTVNAGAYLGSEDPAHSTDATAINSYLARFGATTPGIIGFDIAPTSMSQRTVDLTGVNLGSLTGGAYLGTASFPIFGDGYVSAAVRLTGTIAPSSDNVHRFAAYKGGALEVAGTLGTTASLVIGHPDSLGAFGDRNREEYSTVLVSGNNAGRLTGGVTLYGGRLMVGQDTSDVSDHTHALGEGTLTVAPVNFTLDEIDGAEMPAPLLAVAADDDDFIIANSIVLNAPALEVGGDADFRLSGTISGSGALYVGEESDEGFVLTLAGSNTFSGGVYVSDGAKVIVAHDHALGSGPLGFGNASSNYATFTTATPVIGGLVSNESYGILRFEHAGTIATINQTSDGFFRGYFNTGGEGNDTLRIVKSGSATLRLDEGSWNVNSGIQDSAGDPAVHIQVDQGTLVIGQNFFLGNSNNTIRVQGGTLALDRETSNHQQWVYNPVVVADGGRLAGRGAFFSEVTIGGGAIVSPGLSDSGNIGSLAFDHLELDAGGNYEWHIRNADQNGQFQHDIVNVGLEAPAGTLVVNATTSDRFTLKVISVNLAGSAGLAANFDASQAYAWTIFTYDALEGFDPEKFDIDVTGFANSISSAEGDGWFYLSDDGAGHLLLNFSPVPEPSTYALLALGLAFVVCTVRRRR